MQAEAPKSDDYWWEEERWDINSTSNKGSWTLWRQWAKHGAQTCCHISKWSRRLCPGLNRTLPLRRNEREKGFWFLVSDTVRMLTFHLQSISSLQAHRRMWYWLVHHWTVSSSAADSADVCVTSLYFKSSLSINRMLWKFVLAAEH